MNKTAEFIKEHNIAGMSFIIDHNSELVNNEFNIK